MSLRIVRSPQFHRLLHIEPLDYRPGIHPSLKSERQLDILYYLLLKRNSSKYCKLHKINLAIDRKYHEKRI